MDRIEAEKDALADMALKFADAREVVARANEAYRTFVKSQRMLVPGDTLRITLAASRSEYVMYAVVETVDIVHAPVLAQSFRDLHFTAAPVKIGGSWVPQIANRRGWRETGTLRIEGEMESLTPVYRQGSVVSVEFAAPNGDVITAAEARRLREARGG